MCGLPAADNRSRALRHLHELVEALDRRVAHVESAGEADVARDAAALREKAVKRIAELEAEAEDA